jgi:hypothetical protein
MLWQVTMVSTQANGNVNNSAVSTSTDQMGSAMVALWAIHFLDGTGRCYLEGMTGLQVLYSRTHSQLRTHPCPKGVVRIKSCFPPPTQRHHCLPTYAHPTSNRLLSRLFLLPTLGSEPTQMQPFGPSGAMTRPPGAQNLLWFLSSGFSHDSLIRLLYTLQNKAGWYQLGHTIGFTVHGYLTPHLPPLHGDQFCSADKWVVHCFACRQLGDNLEPSERAGMLLSYSPSQTRAGSFLGLTPVQRPIHMLTGPTGRGGCWIQRPSVHESDCNQGAKE